MEKDLEGDLEGEIGGCWVWKEHGIKEIGLELQSLVEQMLKMITILLGSCVLSGLVIERFEK